MAFLLVDIQIWINSLLADMTAQQETSLETILNIYKDIFSVSQVHLYIHSCQLRPSG
jgi:hypothetical protein